MTRDGDKVSLGAVLNGLITAGVIAGGVATTGVAVLAWRADASDTKVAEIDARQRGLVTTSAVMSRDVAWLHSKMDALLEAAGKTVPPQPPLPEPKED